MVDENTIIPELSTKEVSRLKRLMRERHGNITKYAKIIGVSRKTIERICSTGCALPENVQKVRDKILNPSKEVA